MQDLNAPATPPQARSSRAGAAEAGRQGRGHAAAPEGGGQAPNRQEQALQQANPYRSLGDFLYTLMLFILCCYRRVCPHPLASARILRWFFATF